MTKYRLTCRICDTEDAFDSTEAVEDSMWEDVSPLGTLGGGESTHKAYCPEHSLGN